MAKTALSFKDALRQRAEENLPFDNSADIDSSYRFLFGIPEKKQAIKHIPVDKLVDFFTADLHFRDLAENELIALAESIENIGLQDEPIVRAIPDTDMFEIIAGKHRKQAHVLRGWKTVRSKIVEVTDEQAILIATDTNLKRRQNLLPSEKGFAYRLQVEAMRHQGKQIPIPETSVGIRQKPGTTRSEVARIYNVKESVIQQHIRLTYLIPQLLEAVDLEIIPMTAGSDISYYDKLSQEAVYDFCLVEKKQPLNIKTVSLLREIYPPPTVRPEELRKVFAFKSNGVKPSNVISFRRNMFKPYLDKLPDEKQLEKLFLEFLHERFGPI